VDQSAEPVVSLDVVDRGWGVAGEESQGSGLAESAVRPMSVVVALELAQYGCGVSLVDDLGTPRELRTAAMGSNYAATWESRSGRPPA
jgi:hypothetical protein